MSKGFDVQPPTGRLRPSGLGGGQSFGGVAGLVCQERFKKRSQSISP